MAEDIIILEEKLNEMVSPKETFTPNKEAMKLKENLELVENLSVKETENELTDPEIK